MITTNDEELAVKIRTLASHGVSSSTFAREKAEKPWLRAATMPGYNFRLSNVLAALGAEQLSRLPEMNERRQEIARQYTERIARIDGLEPPYLDPRMKHVYQMYTLTVTGKCDRNGLVTRLRELGVGASVHFDPPIHRQPAYDWYGQKYPEDSLENTDWLSNQIVTLPMYTTMTDEECETVVATLESAVRDAGS